MSEIKLFSLHKVSNTKFAEWAHPVSLLEMTLVKKRVCKRAHPSSLSVYSTKGSTQQAELSKQ